MAVDNAYMEMLSLYYCSITLLKTEFVIFVIRCSKIKNNYGKQRCTDTRDKSTEIILLIAIRLKWIRKKDPNIKKKVKTLRGNEKPRSRNKRNQGMMPKQDKSSSRWQ